MQNTSSYISIVAQICGTNIQNCLTPGNSYDLDGQTALLVGTKELVLDMAKQVEKYDDTVFYRNVEDMKSFEDNKAGYEVVIQSLEELEAYINTL